MKSRRINYIIAEITDQYLIDDGLRPWIIGFSGGKDSTVLLQLVWYAVSQLPKEKRLRNIYVVCNDTLVENPVIVQFVNKTLDKIQTAAVSQGIPVHVHRTIPKLEDTFWVNVIGRGYPVPNNTFRWCTDKMKIKPTSRFLTEQISEFGQAIILIGTRSDESATRANSIKRHEIRGQRLRKHPHNPNTFVYAPIKDLILDEVWYIIHAMTSPWGADNSELFRIYMNASADDYECPTVVTDKSHGSCGQSRFGCWTCTVVKEDKSLTGLVANGYKWLDPLLQFREKLFNGRNMSENRMPTRRNGQSAVTADGHHQGTYTPQYRVELLTELLTIQKQLQQDRPEIKLITDQELVAIQIIWHRDTAWSNTVSFPKSVSEIYNKIYDKEIDMGKHAEKIEKELALLQNACESNQEDMDLIKELLNLQRNKALMVRKRGLRDEIEQVIEKSLNKPA